jgi:MSHA biogenesis protein MshM
VNTPFPYRDFNRVHKIIETAIADTGEPYVVVTGETGVGKTALLRQLKSNLDRARFKVCYFSEACRLGAPGLVRVAAEALRIRVSMNHALTLDRLLRALSEETAKLLLWLDEAHDLPAETLNQARALVEANLDGKQPAQIVFAGHPRLAADLKALPHLWRRINVCEELLGLERDEMQDFATHHLGAAASKRFSDAGLLAIFEAGKGSPGLILPIFKRVVATASGKSGIDTEHIQQTIARLNTD